MHCSKCRSLRKIAIWIPSIIALFVLLFHIEVIGSVSHLFHRSSLEFECYRVEVPTHWMIHDQGREIDGRPYIWTLTGRGVLRGWHDEGWGWNHFQRGLAAVEVHWLEPSSESPKLRLQHEFSDALPKFTSSYAVPGGYIDCGEYTGRPGWRFIYAHCVGKADASDWMIDLSFVGRPDMLPEFYSFARSHVHMDPNRVRISGVSER